MSNSSSAAATVDVTTYDATPYPSVSFPQSHPNRLAAMARLFGLPAVGPGTARVLELGCADGANLLPMAEQAPQATFLGIDASKVQIAAGHAAVAAAGLKNVELRLQDILNFPASEGKFDYIIVHGIFSWVPEPVREKILEICAHHLAENGVAYVSYNALPGWNMRRSLRDMMLFHTASIADPVIKVQQARALLAFMAESVPTENSAYGLLLKSESEALAQQPDNFIRHDILEEENTPFYLHEFVGRASRHALQYLGESSLSQMLAGNFPEKVRDTLARIGTNIVAQEQYMDFLRNRTFRQTLLCRATAPVKRQVTAELMKGFSFQPLFGRPEKVDLAPGVEVTFTGGGGLKINASDPFLKSALDTLAKAGTQAVPYAELLQQTRESVRTITGEATPERLQWEDGTLQANLLNLYSRGFAEIYGEPVKAGGRVPERPEVTALVRHHALHARMVTNRLHYAVPIDVLGRYVASQCDGQRSRLEILAAVVGFALEGKIQVAEEGKPLTDAGILRTALGPRVDSVLAGLARNGFFAA